MNNDIENVLLIILGILLILLIIYWIKDNVLTKHKVVETHYKNQLSDDVELIYYEYYKKYPFCKWKLYEVQTAEQFAYECHRFRELCHGDWKSYMNFEVDNTIYYID